MFSREGTRHRHRETNGGLILAVVWWRRSAADNVATAQCNLGTMPFLAAQGVAEAAAALRRLRIAPA